MCVLLDVIEVQQYAPQWTRKIQIMTLRSSPDALYPIELLSIFRPPVRPEIKASTPSR
jgi:hypothetical protein